MSEQANERAKWHGTISGAMGDREGVEALGITVTNETPEGDGDYARWTVTLDGAALDRLDPLWGRYIWSLDCEDGKAYDGYGSNT